MVDGEQVGACSKYGRCPSYDELREQLKNANQQLVIFRTFVEVIQQYPDFDDPTTGFGLAIDEILSGQVPTMLIEMKRILDRII